MNRSLGIRKLKKWAHLPDAECRHWEIDTSGAKDAQGNAISRHRWPLHDVTKSRAIQILQARVARIQQGLDPVPKEEPDEPQRKPGSPLTFSEYVEGKYLPWLTRKAASTYANRKKHINKYLKPIVGSMTMKEVATPEATTAVYESLKAVVFKRKGKQVPLSRSYKNGILISLSAIIGHASNPRTCRPTLCEAISVELFPEERGRSHDVKDGFSVGQHRQKAVPLDRVHSLLQACQRMPDPDVSYVLIGLGLYAGCRVGEAAARRWTDIDWHEGTICIHSQVCGQLDEYKPYTKNKVERVIALAPPMLEALRRLQKTSLCEFILGPRLIRGQKHLVDKDRPYLSTRNMGDRFAKLTLAAWGVENRTFHALRHRYATQLADNDVPVHEIQKLCGHTQIKTTYGYISPNNSRIQAASRALDYRPKLEVLAGGRRVG